MTEPRIREIPTTFCLWVLTLAVVVAGCSNSDESPLWASSEAAITTAAGVDAGDSQAIVDPPAEPTRCEVTSIVLPTYDELQPFPGWSDHRSAFPYLEVYAGLTRIDPHTGAIEEGLIESYSISPDGKTYRFKLRDALRFSDGTMLRPTDVSFGWSEALKRVPQSLWLMDTLGNIVGADAVASGDASTLAGFTEIDDSSFEVRLSRRDANWLAKLARPVASIIQETDVSQWILGSTTNLAGSTQDWVFDGVSSVVPVGTGRYKVDEISYESNYATYIPNIHYPDHNGTSANIIQRDPNLHASTEPPPISFFDVFEVTPDAAATYDVDGNGSSSITVNGERLSGYKLVQSRRIPTVTFLAFNTALAPFDDVNFRRALATSAVIEDLDYRRATFAQPQTPTGLLPPDIAGHTPRSAPTSDRETATELMDKSRYADDLASLRLRFDSIGFPSPYDFELLTEKWVDWFGLRVRYSGATETSFGYSIGPDARAVYDRNLAAGNLQMMLVEAGLTYDQPEEILGIFRNLFGPNADSPEVQELNRLIDEAAAEPDDVKRIKKYQGVEAHILDRALVMPIAWGSPTKYEIVRDWIDGYQPSPYLVSQWANVTVDTTHPAYPSDRPCD